MTKTRHCVQRIPKPSIWLNGGSLVLRESFIRRSVAVRLQDQLFPQVSFLLDPSSWLWIAAWAFACEFWPQKAAWPTWPRDMPTAFSRQLSCLASQMCSPALTCSSLCIYLVSAPPTGKANLFILTMASPGTFPDIKPVTSKLPRDGACVTTEILWDL